MVRGSVTRADQRGEVVEKSATEALRLLKLAVLQGSAAAQVLLLYKATVHIKHITNNSESAERALQKRQECICKVSLLFSALYANRPYY